MILALILLLTLAAKLARPVCVIRVFYYTEVYKLLIVIYYKFDFF
jgi:hypothetical protein